MRYHTFAFPPLDSPSLLLLLVKGTICFTFSQNVSCRGIGTSDSDIGLFVGLVLDDLRGVVSIQLTGANRNDTYDVETSPDTVLEDMVSGVPVY